MNDNEQHIEQVMQRLEKLERQNTSLKITFLLTIIMVLSGILLWGDLGSAEKLEASVPTAQVSDVIQAEGFVLVDSTGTKRAEMTMLGTNSPAILLYDSSNEIRLSASLVPDGNPKLTLFDSASKERVSMKFVEDNPGLYLFDPMEASRLQMNTFGAEGWPSLSFKDGDGDSRLSLDGRDRDDYGGVLRVHSDDGSPAVMITVDEDKNGSVGVFNHKGVGRILSAK